MIQFIIIKGSTGFDITQLVEKITWSGRKGAAPRSIKAIILDDDGQGHPRIDVDCENGDTCMLYENEIELFRGIIIDHTQSNTKRMTLTAYDNMFYLANNKDSFCYTNQRADQIFTDCMTRIGTTVGGVANTEYIIPELPKAKTTYYDVLLDALSTTYKATGVRYYIASTAGAIYLKRRSEDSMQWVLEVGGNITSYSYSKSISKIVTRIRLLSKEDAVVYEQANEAIESKIGRFMDVKQVDDSYNSAQIAEMGKSMLDEKGLPIKTLSVSGSGITEVISGGCVYVVIPHLNLERAFYIDEDSHEFDGNKHTMTLKLNFATDINAAG